MRQPVCDGGQIGRFFSPERAASLTLAMRGKIEHDGRVPTPCQAIRHRHQLLMIGEIAVTEYQRASRGGGIEHVDVEESVPVTKRVRVRRNRGSVRKNRFGSGV